MSNRQLALALYIGWVLGMLAGYSIGVHYGFEEARNIFAGVAGK